MHLYFSGFEVDFFTTPAGNSCFIPALGVKISRFAVIIDSSNLSIADIVGKCFSDKFYRGILFIDSVN